MPRATQYLLLEIGFCGVERAELLVAIVLSNLSGYLSALAVKVCLQSHIRCHISVNDVPALAVTTSEEVVAARRDIQEELIVDALFLIQVAQTLLEIVASMAGHHRRLGSTTNIPKLDREVIS